MEFAVVEVEEHEKQGQKDVEMVEEQQLRFDVVVGQAAEVEQLLVESLVVRC